MATLNLDFTLKINRYLSNPYDFTLSKLCVECNLSENDVIRIINDNEFLKFKYKNILFSKKTTANELYELLLNPIAPVFNSKKDLNTALIDPAFNLAYSFYINDEKTPDYFKLLYEKKMHESELQNLLMTYLKRLPYLVKELEIHKLQLKRDSLNDFSNYT